MLVVPGLLLRFLEAFMSMNIRTNRWLMIIAVFVSLIIATVGVEAKKGGGGKPTPEDSCLNPQGDFPAFMFWRNTGTQNNPEHTIYLASEDGSCIRSLVAIPDSSWALYWDSAFSYDPRTKLGRVVWSRGDPHVIADVWLQEFTVGEGNTVTPANTKIILLNPDPATMNIIDIDISEDLQKLAFIYYEAESEGLITWETHVIEIDSCINQNGPCVPDSTTRILGDPQPYEPYFFWTHIVWDQLGERIYLRQHRGTLEQWAIRMITLIDGTWTDEKELFTTDEYPEYAGLSNMSSGGPGDREKLAFGHNGEYGSCRTIAVIDVADCEQSWTEFNPRPCEAEAQFFGKHLSWTDGGTIIHEIVERGKKANGKGMYMCRNGVIGEWDPAETGIRPLVDGDNPDAG